MVLKVRSLQTRNMNSKSRTKCQFHTRYPVTDCHDFSNRSFEVYGIIFWQCYPKLTQGTLHEDPQTEITLY